MDKPLKLKTGKKKESTLKGNTKQQEPSICPLDVEQNKQIIKREITGLFEAQQEQRNYPILLF